MGLGFEHEQPGSRVRVLNHEVKTVITYGG